MIKLEPTWEEINNLSTPLTEGERIFVEDIEFIFQDDPTRHLEVFVQANINGDRPDIVVVEKGQGIWIIEVKDWNLDLYHVRQGNWYIGTSEFEEQQVKSPFQQALRYKDNFFDLHSHYLASRKQTDSSLSGMIRTGVYFHNAPEATALEHREAEFGDSRKKLYQHTFGYDTPDDELANFFSTPQRKIADHEYDHLMRFIRSSEEARPMREIDYNKKQLSLIQSEPKRQKIKGVAGSGKSLVLAARAVNALKRTNGKILIITFNITLVNYLHDLISEVRGVYRRQDFEIISYHRFIDSMCNNLGIVVGEKGEFDSFDARYNDLKLFEPVKDSIHPYDAIFIDEVQDFEYNWLQIVSHYFLKENGEFVLFGDEKQNIYNRELEDKQIRTNVVGAWNILSDSYRLSTKTTELATAFQEFFLKDRYEMDPIDIQLALDLEEKQDDTIHYVYTDDAMNQIPEVQKYFEESSIHPNDIVFLGVQKNVMRKVDSYIRKASGERTLTTFISIEDYERLSKEDVVVVDAAERKLERARKVGFWMNSGTVKLSTVQSFKGWEANHIVLIISRNTDNQKEVMDELIYTGITRCKQNLIIINEGNERMHDFFIQNRNLYDSFVG